MNYKTTNLAEFDFIVEMLHVHYGLSVDKIASLTGESRSVTIMTFNKLGLSTDSKNKELPEASVGDNVAVLPSYGPAEDRLPVPVGSDIPNDISGSIKETEVEKQKFLSPLHAMIEARLLFRINESLREIDTEDQKSAHSIASLTKAYQSLTESNIASHVAKIETEGTNAPTFQIMNVIN
jgi:hypothetical protein